MTKGKRVAVVTGGVSALGKAIVLRLASDGYAVGVVDSDHLAGQAVAEAAGGIFVAHDMKDFAHAPEAMEEVAQKLGGIHVMVNCAAVCPTGASEDITAEEWDNAMDTNLKGMFFAIQAVIPFMKKNEDGGSIVNVSSMRARQATGDHLLYGASMAGVSAMSRELATDLWRYGIKCNTVAPWDVFTANDPRMKDEDFVKEQVGYLLADRVVQPEDVSEVVSFLVSDGAYCINAFEIPVDSGANLVREKPVKSAYK
jgi:NAD(P)-dependent dehydrogenase (short-subunit alcohol dehydrogenase family)